MQNYDVQVVKTKKKGGGRGSEVIDKLFNSDGSAAAPPAFEKEWIHLRNYTTRCICRSRSLWYRLTMFVTRSQLSILDSTNSANISRIRWLGRLFCCFRMGGVMPPSLSRRFVFFLVLLLC